MIKCTDGPHGDVVSTEGAVPTVCERLCVPSVTQTHSGSLIFYLNRCP